MATSVVGSFSCFRKNHRAGYIVPASRPSTSTVTYAVTICLRPSSLTRIASLRTLKRPIVVSCPGARATSTSRL